MGTFRPQSRTIDQWNTQPVPELTIWASLASGSVEMENVRNNRRTRVQFHKGHVEENEKNTRKQGKIQENWIKSMTYRRKRQKAVA